MEKRKEIVKTLVLREPCNCGEKIRHNNGGNYHEVLYLVITDEDAALLYADSSDFNPPLQGEGLLQKAVAISHAKGSIKMTLKEAKKLLCKLYDLHYELELWAHCRHHDRKFEEWDLKRVIYSYPLNRVSLS